VVATNPTLRETLNHILANVCQATRHKTLLPRKLDKAEALHVRTGEVSGSLFGRDTDCHQTECQ
jgi:hypothetical protein